MTDRARTIAGLILLLTAALVLLGAAADPPEARMGGWHLIGAREATQPGVAAFRGIPFAHPPLGERRFRAAELLPAPDAGVFEATRYAPVCPQDEGNVDWYRDVARGVGADPAALLALPPVSEDCLHLNLWTPAPGRPAAGLPVFVWIHGGGNQNGWSYEPNYLGQHLAAEGLVVVSIAYRLGGLGFVAHPLLSAESAQGASGHYGMSDILAALQWIRQHIAAFGGDPDNVTVAGESAGGGNISALLRVRAADGLYRRAIIQSGALGPEDRQPLDAAQRAGERLFAALQARSAEDLRRRPWQDFIGLDWGAYYPGWVIDGELLREAAAIREGVDLLIGSNAQEWLMYMAPDGDAALQKVLGRYARGREPEARALLQQLEPDPRRQADRLFSAVEFLCPSTELAAEVRAGGGRSFVYHFTRVRPGAARIGAYHGAEIPYVFGTADAWLPGDDTDAALSRAMLRYWAGFARSGRPAAGDLPAWPEYDREARSYLELGDRIAPGTDLERALCTLASGQADGR
ncbi:MAG: carboxylesterase family protein [Myxococcales bacterium]|nr:carboxylesterase family protein [Myxococcales bacterium]MDH5306276.1 carboxylesterase family protein [Myxococcales bacterium]MDH5566787.1 carboxylesterase family protein [Myxococcales bacterium]